MLNSPVIVTGIIPAAGTTPTAGTGFTYTHVGGSGIYVFTFSPVFAATPVVVVTVGSAPFCPDASGVSASGFTVLIQTTAGVNTDIQFNFIAHGVV
jgi:hypothetical protein